MSEIVERVAFAIEDAETDFDGVAVIGSAFPRRPSPKALAVALAVIKAMSEWRPIETAPKDGTLVDLWSATYNARLPDCKFEQQEWDEQGHWYQAYSENPSSFHYVSQEDLTHWMPRPPAPSDGDRTPEAACSLLD